VSCRAEAKAVADDFPAAAALAEGAAVAEATGATRWSTVSSLLLDAMYLEEIEALAAAPVKHR
jgi:hypothetical protein